MELLGGFLAGLEEIPIGGASCLAGLLAVLGENALAVLIQDNLAPFFIENGDSLGALGGLTDHVVEGRVGNDPAMLEREDVFARLRVHDEPGPIIGIRRDGIACGLVLQGLNGAAGLVAKDSVNLSGLHKRLGRGLALGVEERERELALHFKDIMGCQGGDKGGSPCPEKGVGLGGGKVVITGGKQALLSKGYGVGELLKLNALRGLGLDGWGF